MSIPRQHGKNIHPTRISLLLVVMHAYHVATHATDDIMSRHRYYVHNHYPSRLATLVTRRQACISFAVTFSSLLRVGRRSSSCMHITSDMSSGATHA
eukprot:1195523-Prorocentrum_minimum.AAC.5